MIRKAENKDLSRIAEIQVFNYRLYFYPIFQCDEYYFDELQVPALMRKYEEELDSLYVYDDGVVKGFIKIEGTYIARLFVEPVLQNASIGSRLLEYAVNEHHVDHLWVLEKNIKAIRFYERHGFAFAGEKKLEEGTTEYLMLLKKGNLLEKMDDFFTARIQGYDEHMRDTIEGADTFYRFTASLLPREESSCVLDLGCGTGLELEEYFLINPNARITGIDLTQAMLNALKSKFPNKDLTLICGSYFQEPLGIEKYDAAVSVESLHHFTKEEKTTLYRKLKDAIKNGGYFVLTDYFAELDEQEVFFRQELMRLRREQNLQDDVFYHYDTPLTVEHEKEALMAAGFSSVEIMGHWGTTYTLKATK